AKQLSHYLRGNKTTAIESEIAFDDIIVGKEIIGTIEDAFQSRYEDFVFHVGIGYKHLARREQLINRVVLSGRELYSYTHPTAIIDKSASVGRGIMVFPGTVVGPGCTIGDGAVLHACVTLAHDVTIGNSSFLAPGVVVSGFVTLGVRSFLGTGTLVANQMAI